MRECRIRYRNSQGTLLRILLTATRRGLDVGYVLAEPAAEEYCATLRLAADAKQWAQLGRDWRAIVDVLAVESPPAARD